MRTQTTLLVVMVTVAAFGLLISGFANAEQTAVGSGTMLVKGGGGHHGGHHGGGHHGGGHHGGHFFHGKGYYGGYYPYGNYYYNTSPNCVWNGYKYVCYDSSSDYYDTY